MSSRFFLFKHKYTLQIYHHSHFLFAHMGSWGQFKFTHTRYPSPGSCFKSPPHLYCMLKYNRKHPWNLQCNRQCIRRSLLKGQFSPPSNFIHVRRFNCCLKCTVCAVHTTRGYKMRNRKCIVFWIILSVYSLTYCISMYYHIICILHFLKWKSGIFSLYFFNWHHAKVHKISG